MPRAQHWLKHLSTMAKINIYSIRNLLPRQRLFAGAGLLFLIILSLTSPLSAQSVTKGYGSDQKLQRGMMVAVRRDDPNKVEAINKDSLDRLKGVVVEANDSPITLSSDKEKVFVSTAGNNDVLVSDENGAIQPGDYISISSLAGVGMKVGEEQSIILGRALNKFEGKEDSIGTTQSSSGRAIHFGRVQVAISINRNPLVKTAEGSDVPSFLKKVGAAVADKPVSSIRVYLAATVFLATAIITGVILYSGVRNTLISIGRNPLSKKTIYKGLMQIILMGLIIFITGLFGVYLLLKL